MPSAPRLPAQTWQEAGCWTASRPTGIPIDHLFLLNIASIHVLAPAGIWDLSWRPPFTDIIGAIWCCCDACDNSHAAETSRTTQAHLPESGTDNIVLFNPHQAGGRWQVILPLSAVECFTPRPARLLGGGLGLFRLTSS